MDKEWFDALAAISGINRQHEAIEWNDKGKPIAYEKIGESIYDPKPLAALLRSGKIPPPDACLMLAELIDPLEPPCVNMRLVPRPIMTERKNAELISNIQLVGEYHRLTDPNGESRLSSSRAIEKLRQDAVEKGQTEEPPWSDDSVFFRIRRKVLAFLTGLKATDRNF